MLRVGGTRVARRKVIQASLAWVEARSIVATLPCIEPTEDLGADVPFAGPDVVRNRITTTFTTYSRLIVASATCTPLAVGIQTGGTRELHLFGTRIYVLINIGLEGSRRVAD